MYYGARMDMFLDKFFKGRHSPVLHGHQEGLSMLVYAAKDPNLLDHTPAMIFSLCHYTLIYLNNNIDSADFIGVSQQVS